MNRHSIEIVVGLFVLAGIAALIMLTTKVGNLGGGGGLDDGYTVIAKFDNIGGLNVKAPVTMAGVRVGRVTDISVDREDYVAVVTMSLSSEYDNMPKDTAASILTSGLLGSQFIGLDPGGDENMLGEGDEIKLTQSALQLEELISQMVFMQAEKKE